MSIKVTRKFENWPNCTFVPSGSTFPLKEDVCYKHVKKTTPHFTKGICRIEFVPKKVTRNKFSVKEIQL